MGDARARRGETYLMTNWNRALGNRALAQTVAALAPRREPGTYVYALSSDGIPPGVEPLATFRDRDGLTLVLDDTQAAAAGLEPVFTAAWITVNVETELEGVGFVALLSAAFADQGIPSNIMAAAHLDHFFVPVDRADDAVAVLEHLKAEAAAFLAQ